MAAVAASQGREKMLGVVFVGDEEQSKRCVSTLKYPIVHGTITNLDDVMDARRTRTQCPSTNVMLCITPSFVWLKLTMNLTATAERVSAPDVIEKLCYIFGDFDKELTRRRPASSQTETSLL